MQVLLIWQTIPEDIELYILEGDRAKAAAEARGCEDPAEAIDRLSQILDGIEPVDKTLELTPSMMVIRVRAPTAPGGTRH